jgi:hypothetical protein
MCAETLQALSGAGADESGVARGGENGVAHLLESQDGRESAAEDPSGHAVFLAGAGDAGERGFVLAGYRPSLRGQAHVDGEVARPDEDRVDAFDLKDFAEIPYGLERLDHDQAVDPAVGALGSVAGVG